MNQNILSQIADEESHLKDIFQELEKNEFYALQRVLEAFRENKIGEHHLQGTYGYGHDDLGRDALENVFATVFGAEAALVRPHIASGTHAIAATLFGILRPGDELLFVTGRPYDTLEEVIGLRGKTDIGHLKNWQIDYRQVDIRDYSSAEKAPWDDWLRPNTKLVMIQRSRGYSWRSSISIQQIKEITQQVKQRAPETIIFVDNCYGELVEQQEPCHVGANVIAGSLIKNPGGGIVPAGGYVCGDEELIEKIACRVYAPGMGRESGATLNFNRTAFQGFFMAAHTVTQSLKGAILAASMFEKRGIEVSPTAREFRTDTIQALRWGSPELLTAFCHGVQLASPIDSYVKPIPYKVAGYEDDIIMAAGTFAEGSSIELSADGPLRPPFIGYLQGGLSYTHCKLALASILELIENNH